MTELIPTLQPHNKNSGNNSFFPGNLSSCSIDTLMDQTLTEGNYLAFELLFKTTYASLCQYCLTIVSVKEVAEELVSDVFYNIWKNRLKIVVSSPKAYLYTSVRNKGFDYLRSIKNKVACDIDKALSVESYEADSHALLIQNELQDLIDKSVQLLPRQCRLIYEMSRDQGMKYKEIAEHLNISVKTVETQMGRALKHLRRSLDSSSER